MLAVLVFVEGKKVLSTKYDPKNIVNIHWYPWGLVECPTGSSSRLE